MFSVKWYNNCYLCGDFILSQSEHLMLYCIKLNDFRESLWYRLLSRFDVNYFNSFMSHSPERQLDLLFSGPREILNEEKDVIDCIKLFLMSLSKIPVYSSYIICWDTYIHVRIRSIVGNRYPSFGVDPLYGDKALPCLHPMLHPLKLSVRRDGEPAF